jgi:hypothetical protein
MPAIRRRHASIHAFQPRSYVLPKPNYEFAKRQRELIKKQKKEAKRQRKAESDEGEPPAVARHSPADEKTAQ